MMPAIKERTEDWRAKLAQDAKACRNLWANVALNAINDATHEIIKARKKKIEGAEEGTIKGSEEGTIKRFRAWAESANGRLVLQLAGIDPNDRVIDNLCRTILAGELQSGASRGRRPSRAA